MMRTRNFGRDTQLTVRMLFTMFMLALVYVAFIGMLSLLGIGYIPILVISLLMVLFQYYMSDRLVLWSTGAKVVTPEQEPKLHTIVERLAETASIPKPKVAIMQTDVPNAFATGRNPKNAVVAVTTGLRSRLGDRELEAVLGHELSHIKNRDILIMTWASVILVAAAFLLRMLFWSSLFGGFGGGRRNGNQAALVMMAVMVGTFVIYIIAQLLILALSRYREYAADRGGAVLTGAPSQLASALTKISGAIARIPQKDLREVSAANAFFIVNTLKGDNLANLLASHPPVEKRIERLRILQKQLEGF